jgi:hypothetical protein
MNIVFCSVCIEMFQKQLLSRSFVLIGNRVNSSLAHFSALCTFNVRLAALYVLECDKSCSICIRM